jgi:hypothetical protein
MANINLDSILQSIPPVVVIVLAGIGFANITRPIISYVRLLLSLFVLTGTSVCSLV